MENKKPKKIYKSGQLSLFRWDNENGKSFTFQKSFKDKDSDEWKHTQNLNLMDLPKLKLLVEEAFKDCSFKTYDMNNG